MDKQEFKQKAKQKIDDVFTRINQLEAKKDKIADSMKSSYETQLAELRKQKQELEKSYHQMEETSGERWDEARQHFSQSAEAFKEGVSKLTAMETS
jgi:DNA repair exonuclease SbcCD ATPase subunit